MKLKANLLCRSREGWLLFQGFAQNFRKMRSKRYLTDVTSMTAVVSWQTSPATESCLDLDGAIHPIFPSPRPIGQTFQGVAYAPGEYDGYLNWVDRDLVTDTIISDVEAIAAANFNAIVLYPAGPLGGAIHPWDRITLDEAAAQDLKIAFRLEWYPSSFAWESADCEIILNHYIDGLATTLRQKQEAIAHDLDQLEKWGRIGKQTLDDLLRGVSSSYVLREKAEGKEKEAENDLDSNGMDFTTSPETGPVHLKNPILGTGREKRERY